MITQPKTLLSLVVALAGGLALAQDTPDASDLSDPEEPEPVAEALLDPIPIALGADDFEFAFELVRFDLDQADTTEGKVSFEILLESKPDYISDFKLDKTVLSFDPGAFTGKIIASLDVAKEASSDGVDEIVLLLKAKDEATKPQEGKVTIPLELLERSDLFLLARVHTENLNVRNILFTSEGVLPEEVPSIASIKRAIDDKDVPNPPNTVRNIATTAAFFRDPEALAALARSAIEEGNDPFLRDEPPPLSVEELVELNIEHGTPLGVAAQHLAGLPESGVETFYIAAQMSEERATPHLSILRPPPPPELDDEGNPKLDAEGNPLPEEGREAKWQAFQSLAAIAEMTAHDVDGWMVATKLPPIDPEAGVAPPLPEGADAESVLMKTLPTRLMEGMVDESKADGLPLLQALEDSPPSDLSIAFLIPQKVRERARADFEESKSEIPAEERHLIPIIDKLLKALDHEWVRLSITFGQEPDLELLAKFEDEGTSAALKETFDAFRGEAIKMLKVKPHKNPKIMQVRQHNRDINARMLRRITFLTEEGFLQLEEPEKLIKTVLTDALGLQGEPRDDGSYDDDGDDS